MSRTSTLPARIADSPWPSTTSGTASRSGFSRWYCGTIDAAAVIAGPSIAVAPRNATTAVMKATNEPSSITPCPEASSDAT